MTISEIEASKLSGANCRTREPGVTANVSIWLEASGPMPAWETSTPLGRPVKPEV